MNGDKGHTLRLKSLMISDDEGKTWTLVRQYYLTDATANRFLNELLQGKRFAIITGETNGNDTRDQSR